MQVFLGKRILPSAMSRIACARSGSGVPSLRLGKNGAEGSRISGIGFGCLSLIVGWAEGKSLVGGTRGSMM